MRLSEAVEQAVVWAAALTSLKMEKLGPFTRSRQDVARLIQSKYAQQIQSEQTTADGS